MIARTSHAPASTAAPIKTGAARTQRSSETGVAFEALTRRRAAITVPITAAAASPPPRASVAAATPNSSAANIAGIQRRPAHTSKAYIPAIVSAANTG